MPSGPTDILLLGSIEESTGTKTGVTTGTSRYINGSDYPNMAVCVEAIGNPGAGTIIIEEAYWNPLKQVAYGGTWSPIQSIDASTLVTDAQYIAHLATSSYKFWRVRISVDITVATVMVYAFSTGKI